MNTKVIIILFTLLLGGGMSYAQNSKTFFENIVKNEDNQDRQPIALPHVEPSDVVWCKTVWRELVLREKMNLPFYYPTVPVDGRMSLVDVLMTGIEKSFKTAYDDDELQTPLTLAEIKEKFGASTDTLMKRNAETGEMEAVAVSNEIHTDEVKRFQIKELWYFNKRTSRLEVRIISLCPIREYVKEDGADGILKRELFWVDYGEFRDIFVKQRVYNFQNDALRMSLDDVFLKRFFSSRIIKETNPYDNRSIQSYSTGIDAVLESDRIKNEIFTYEQDLWEY
ncbi:MAG: gliding motility protein GldN [Odoribacter sp.]|nr:gliding motility protein GldN [Odoribacter sp.]